MRILLIYQQFLGEGEPGISRFNEFAKHWAESGHEVSVLSGMVNYTTGHKEARYRGKFVVKEQLMPNITVYRCFIDAGLSPGFWGRIWRFLSFAFSALLVGLMRVGEQDVVVASSPPLFVGITGLLIGFFRRIPFVFEVRDLWPESAIETGMIKSGFIKKCSFWLEKLNYKRAVRVNAVTPAISSAIENKGILSDKLFYVPNGADLEYLQPGPKSNWVRETYGWGDKFVVLYMGAHGLANHLTQILEVAQRLDDHPDIQFAFVGSGLEKNQLVEKAHEMGLQNVHFIDPQPRRSVADFINAADVCTAVLLKRDVFKTVYPNKVFDYMACSKPIIIAIDGAARCLVEDASAGEYAEPEDPVAYKRVLLKFYNEREILEQYGQNGYRYVQRHFSREQLANKYLDVLIETRGKNSIETD